MHFWEVVGGGESGGIVVREGKDIKSPALEGRLQTGSVVMQVEAVEDRLHYYYVMGDGPPEGWVSIKTKSATLMKERDLTKERWFAAIKELRSAAKKDPAKVKVLAKELMELKNADKRLLNGMVSQGALEACALAMKANPADVEMQGLLVSLTGDLCLFNGFASRKAGKCGVVEAAIAWFMNNPEKRDVQGALGCLGCYLDYDEENRQLVASMGCFKHCFDMCIRHAQDADVCFAALCAASNPSDHYSLCMESGAAQVLLAVLTNFFWDDKVKSEAGMVARGLLQSGGEDCAVRFGEVGLGVGFVKAVRENLRSRPMQANGCLCFGLVAKSPEHRDAVVRAGGIDVLLAVCEENTRELGVCWGLQGMEDNLWRVLDNCAIALANFLEGRDDLMVAMIEAGAVDILKAGLERRGPSEPAQNLLGALEARCQADPSVQPRPRTSFEGRWIANTHPASLGVYSVVPDEGGSLAIALEGGDPGYAAFWSRAPWQVSGSDVTRETPEDGKWSGSFANGRIRFWNGEMEIIFYPFNAVA